jgi:hypothetical protein
VFVTPRNWPGKKDWVAARQKEAHWKDVRALDASDLEQWLEMSAPAQIWLSERLGRPVRGYSSLALRWKQWASASEPELSSALFAPAIASFRNSFAGWLNRSPNRPFVVAADSRGEALAFLSCLTADPEVKAAMTCDQIIVFDSADAVSVLASASDRAFIAVASTSDVETALAPFYRRFHCITVRPRNLVSSEPDIVLDLLKSTDFECALEDMGIADDRVRQFERASGRSPTILRRLLAKGDAIRKPHWAEDQAIAPHLVPVALTGAWNAETTADCQVVSLLANADYGSVEEQIAKIRKTEDSPVWSIGKYRGVASKIDALFAIADFVTQQHIDLFFLAAEYVLSEDDPALELPEDKRPFASLYGKVRDHSAILRNGVCETLVLLAVHGNALFFERLGVDLQARVGQLIAKLLTPFTAQALHSHNRDLPNYAEAAPDVFLDLIEQDLRSDEPVVFELLRPADSSLFGGGCPRTGLLWALECLAWKPERLLRVAKILAALSRRKIDDNWHNKPEETLKSIFRSWMPQTAAPVEERVKVLEYLAEHEPEVAWDLCTEQFETGSRIGDYNYRPQWRGDASGAGQPVTQRESFVFIRKAVDICLSWPAHNERTLGDLVERLQVLSDEDQTRVWDLIDNWLCTRPSDWAKAALRERIRRYAPSRSSPSNVDVAKAALRERIRRYAFTRFSRHHNISGENAKRARAARKALMPTNPLVRHQWLFASQWVPESYDELENDDFDYEVREPRLKIERTEALREIWEQSGFDGLQELLRSSGANGLIGSIMVDVLRKHTQQVEFVKSCLLEPKEDIQPAIRQCLSGFLFTIEQDTLSRIFAEIRDILNNDQLTAFFLSMPFCGATWHKLDDQPEPVSQGYWKAVIPYWGDLPAQEVNEAIDRLLDVNRSAAAFHAVHLSLKHVDSSRLIRLLRAIVQCPDEQPPPFRIANHYISDAFQVLNKRSDVSIEEKANLEFIYLAALDHSRHGIPNLEKQMADSPELFVQAIVMGFKRRDEGEDPEEWTFSDPDKQRSAVLAIYRLLDRLRRTPGTDDSGVIRINDLKEWLLAVREQCRRLGRAEIGDDMIGQLLSRSESDADGNWPSRPVCEALEWMASEYVGRGFCIGTRNARSVHWRGEGSDQERELAERYRTYAQRIGFEFPYVRKLLKSIADSYYSEAQWQDTDAKVRSRIAY